MSSEIVYELNIVNGYKLPKNTFMSIRIIVFGCFAFVGWVLPFFVII